MLLASEAADQTDLRLRSDLAGRERSWQLQRNHMRSVLGEGGERITKKMGHFEAEVEQLQLIHVCIVCWSTVSPPTLRVCVHCTHCTHGRYATAKH